MGLKEYMTLNGGAVLEGTSLTTATRDELAEEIYKRDSSPNHFPLEVFHDSIKPWVNALVNEGQLPDCYIGLNLLAAYSTAVGTAYAVTANGTDKIFLPCWGCMVGMSSSGKSWIMDLIMKPFDEIQHEFDNQWDEKTDKVAEDKKIHHKLRTVVYRDSFIATLTRYVLPDNPKGVLKVADELLEWINGLDGMNRGKEGIDEQFWVSSWNCRSYRIIRSMKQVYINRRPFVNVFGGITYKKLSRLFGSDRDTNGFVFRILFARPSTDRIPMPNPDFQMPKEWSERHSDCIKTMYHSLQVDADGDDPKLCILTKEARKLWYDWGMQQNARINKMDDPDEREIHAGIFGKMKEYTLRFSALLAISDVALGLAYYNGHDRHANNFKKDLYVDTKIMARALKLADYFFKSAVEVCEIVNVTQFAPLEVLQTAILLKSGRSYQEMAAVIWRQNTPAGKKRMERSLKKWTKIYPKVFQSYSKN